MATTALVRSRRDENAQRRQGTGRHTTKRDFSFNLFGLLAAPASGFKTRLPLAQRSVSQQQLHSVDESAGSCSAAGVAACEAAHAEHIAQPDARMADQPQPEAFDPAHAPTPFRISNKVMRTPAAGKDTGDSVCACALGLTSLLRPAAAARSGAVICAPALSIGVAPHLRRAARGPRLRTPSQRRSQWQRSMTQRMWPRVKT